MLDGLKRFCDLGGDKRDRGKPRRGAA